MSFDRVSQIRVWSRNRLHPKLKSKRRRITNGLTSPTAIDWIIHRGRSTPALPRSQTPQTSRATQTPRVISPTKAMCVLVQTAWQPCQPDIEKLEKGRGQSTRLASPYPESLTGQPLLTMRCSHCLALQALPQLKGRHAYRAFPDERRPLNSQPEKTAYFG